MADLFDIIWNVCYNSINNWERNNLSKNLNNEDYIMSEIKPQYYGAVVTKSAASEKQIEQAKKDGKFTKCPTRRAKGSKNARWGQCE